MISGWDVYRFDTLSSTQDKARELSGEAREGKPFAVMADMQTAGRGRSGRTWSSLRGNLLCTLCLPEMDFPIKDAGWYSFLSAVALTDTLDQLGFDNDAYTLRHKWPNDILVDGRKLSGILLESRLGSGGKLKHLFIGIGVNLQHAPEGAANLSHLLGRVITPDDFLESYIRSFEVNQAAMLDQGFSPIRSKWLDRAYGLGEKLQVRLVTEAFNGTFDGLEDDGALRVLIEGESKPRIVHAGDVFFGKDGCHAACY
ncbi:MAG: biotin--[acetyl-CoA-carboxylase] ligase [Pseudobdellovibrionaceae bacterium]